MLFVVCCCCDVSFVVCCVFVNDVVCFWLLVARCSLFVVIWDGPCAS